MSDSLTDPDAPVAAPEPPCLAAGGQRVWTVSRHADVLAVLRSPDFQSDSPEARIRRIADRAGRTFPQLLAVLQGTMIFQQGGPHRDSRARIRPLVEESMAAWPASRLQAEARRIVAGLPDPPEGSPVDVVPALAAPLPALVVGEALGLAPALCLELQGQALAVSQSWVAGSAVRDLIRMEEAAKALRHTLRAQRAPGWRIGRLGDEGAEGAVDLAAFLLLAGAHSVTSTIAAALDALARQPALQARLRQDPALGAGLLRETLRLAGPIRRPNRRVALAEAEIGGARFLPGDLVLLPTDRAHRDPAAFPDPERLDPARKGAALLAFGGGAHMCQGPVLGTQQAEAMVRAVLERFALRPAADRGALLAHPDLRSFTRLPLHLRHLDAGRDPAKRNPAMNHEEPAPG
ncbi:cytochrome P450 [Falsiroseomonas sp.]|uniref:cytochrome P450 n=1 Tax=Falsiroseomonas sp. TaxID=2870721 RepID=UPI003F6F93F6